MTSRKLATFALCFLTSATSFAIGMRTPNLGGVADEDCGMRSNNGNANAISEVNCMLNPESCLHQAAWYGDRDNSMSEVSTDSGVGAAMAIIDSKNGYSQSIQVCPGVYLATAHGALDSPLKAREEGRDLRDPNDNLQFIDPYPMSDDTFMEIENATFTSPRLDDPSKWNDPTTDYVFIKVSNPTNPSAFVTPVTGSDEDMIDGSRNDFPVHLYRPQTVYNQNDNGVPDFNEDSAPTSFEAVSPIYNAPRKVNQACDLTLPDMFTLFRSSCPNEGSVSGSPEIASINNRNYLTGIHIRGEGELYDSAPAAAIQNTVIQSRHFCSDYEKVCGQPCANINEVNSISL